MVTIFETHTNAVKAEQCFFKEVGEEAVAHYEKGKDVLVVLVKKAWNEMYKPKMVSIIPSVMIAMKWTVDTRRTGWEVSFRLDAFDEDERIKQLDEGRT